MHRTEGGLEVIKSADGCRHTKINAKLGNKGVQRLNGSLLAHRASCIYIDLLLASRKGPLSD